MRILVVEDSERLRRAISTGLSASGFAVDVAPDGEAGLALAQHAPYEVIVLDLMLPKLDGLTMLDKLRRSGCQTHVLILSAKDAIDDRVKGLNLGADDYLSKPFAFDELLARVRALCRRQEQQKDTVLCVGLVALDTISRVVTVSGGAIELSRLEFGLLELLLRRRGRVLSRDYIIDQLYPSATAHESNVLEALVYSVRRKIQPNGAPEVIHTRRGQGYMIKAH